MIWLTSQPDENMGRRTMVVAAKNELEATYKVAIEYSVRHPFREKPQSGDTELFEVSIVAKRVKS